jgi:hypothetical protein
MVITKKIFIIEFGIVTLLLVYLFSSLFLFSHQVFANVQSFEARLWLFNTVTAIILLLFFMVIHVIIRKYSWQHIIENFRFRKLKDVERFKIVLSVGIILTMVTILIIIYALLLIPPENSSVFFPYFILLQVLFYIGILMLIIGVFLNISKMKERSKSMRLPPSKDFMNNAGVVSRKYKSYLVFLTINWIVLMPGFGVLSYVVFKMNMVIISIIMTIWSAASFLVLIYIERKKKEERGNNPA